MQNQQGHKPHQHKGRRMAMARTAHALYHGMTLRLTIWNRGARRGLSAVCLAI